MGMGGPSRLSRAALGSCPTTKLISLSMFRIQNAMLVRQGNISLAMQENHLISRSHMKVP